MNPPIRGGLDSTTPHLSVPTQVIINECPLISEGILNCSSPWLHANILSQIPGVKFRKKKFTPTSPNTCKKGKSIHPYYIISLSLLNWSVFLGDPKMKKRRPCSFNEFQWDHFPFRIELHLGQVLGHLHQLPNSTATHVDYWGRTGSVWFHVGKKGGCSWWLWIFCGKKGAFIIFMLDFFTAHR